MDDINKCIIEMNKKDINNEYITPVPIANNNQNNLYPYNLPDNVSYQISYAQPIVNQNNQQELTINKEQIKYYKNKNDVNCCCVCKSVLLSCCLCMCCINCIFCCCLSPCCHVSFYEQ